MFSSSATVYGDPAYLPLDEKHPVGGCTNPYGKSKYFIEEMIRDLCKAEKVTTPPHPGTCVKLGPPSPWVLAAFKALDSAVPPAPCAGLDPCPVLLAPGERLNLPCSTILLELPQAERDPRNRRLEPVA